MAMDAVTPTWLHALRRYVGVIVPLMLAWETAHLPLYTLWQTASLAELALAVLHCTAGDALIAIASLSAALLLAGDPEWPAVAFRRVLVLAVVAGLGATVYLEWVNVEVRQTWGYAAAMPRLPPLGTGLTPLLQWLVLPPLALLLARRRAGTHHVRHPRRASL